MTPFALGLALAAQAGPAAPPPAVPAVTVTADAPAAVPPADLPVAAAAPPPRRRHARGDPFEPMNRRFFAGHQKFDRHLLRPAALGFARVVPRPVRHGLRNFFSNLGEPLVFLSYLLELKPGKAAETAGRFLINSTLGFGGVFDIAIQPNIHLPHRPNSLSDVLGYYGVKPGPYLFLPLIGPTTLRDLIAGQGEATILPTLVGSPFDGAEYQVTRAVTNGLGVRADSDADLKALLDGAVDPYATFRSVWLQDRQGEIDALHGRRTTKVEAPELGEPLEDPAGTWTGPASPELSDPLTDPATGVTPPSTAPELNDALQDPAAK